MDLFADEQDRVWIGVHFGSRGLGHKTATYFLEQGGAKDGMDVDPASIAVVGDSDQDAEMAASRGMTFIAFTSGAGPLSQAGEGRNRVEMDSLSDVAAFVVEGKLWRKS